MTLKHIIELSGRTENLPQALSCPTAQSLFEAVPWNRNCDDACISMHYCTCTSYKELATDDPIAMNATLFVIDWMNHELDTKAREDDKPLCAIREFAEINLASKSEDTYDIGTPNERIFYMINFKVFPAWDPFVATVEYYTKTEQFKLSADLSRIDEYGKKSHCVNNAILKNTAIVKIY
jgi:hypothetical protein